MNHLLEPRERLVCMACREPVRWAGKWRHTWKPVIPLDHQPRAVTYPRKYYKVGASVSQD